MKITSLSNHIIKHGEDVKVETFVPPARIDDRLVKPFIPVRVAYGDKQTAEEVMAGDVAESAEAEARQILLKARSMAEDILKEAGGYAEKLKKDAIAEGFQEGYEQGVCEGRKQAKQQQEQFEKQMQEEFQEDMKRALESVDQAKETCMRTYLEELKECSVAIAEKVVHISLKSSGEIIKRMLIAETEKLKKRAWVKIYMEKTDYDMMTEADADVVNELAKLSDNIKFVVMDKGNSGSCILEMPDEIVDISVDTQMENIREILENIRF